MERSYWLFVKDIRDSILQIEKFTEGMNYSGFAKDDKTASAVVRKLEIIGEAAKNIPYEIRQKYKSVPWSDMAKMRDKIMHFYFGMDYEVVWKTIKESLPLLKPELEQILNDLKKQDK